MSVKKSKQLKKLETRIKSSYLKFTIMVAVFLGLCGIAVFVIFMGWQRAFAVVGQSKYAREKEIIDTTQQMDRPLVESIKHETNQLLKIK